jgi:mannitol-specific phosphotransferase system IIBC component
VDERSTQASSARTIRTIVCAFTRDELPTAQLAIFRRFEHVFGKSGLKIRVRLEAIESLPEQFDVLVVPIELKDRAKSVLGDAMLYITTRESVAAAADDLLREIRRGDVLTAEVADPNAPKIVTHRGMEIL